MLKKIIPFILAFLSCATISLADAKNSVSSSAPVKLEITDAWARSSLAPSTNSAAYMVFKNNDTQDYEIISATAILTAIRTELHESYVDDQQISRMRAVDKIVIPAQSQIELKPGGTHIMLMGLKQDLKPGDKFIIKIKINNFGIKDVEVTVK